MRKQLISLSITVLICFTLSCGKHESTNFGMTYTKDQNNGIDDKSTSGLLKTKMNSEDISGFLKLLDDGASVDSRLPDSKNATLLIYAAQKNLPVFVFHLLNKNADTELKDEFEKTAFQYALEIGNRDRILMLLDPDRQKQGQLDLMDAIKKKKVPSIEILLKSGVNPNFQEEESGETPLTRSILLKKGSHVTKFIAEWKDVELGISATDINLPNRTGVTPLAYAIKNNNSEVVEFLKNLNAKENL